MSKIDVTHWKQRLPWQLLGSIIIVNIGMQNVSQVYKVKVAKFHSLSFSCGISVLSRKSSRGGGIHPWYIERLSLKKEMPMLFHTKFLEIFSMFFKFVINLILNPYRESSLIHKVLLQILLILGKYQIFLWIRKLILRNERVVFLHSKEQVCEKD